MSMVSNTVCASISSVNEATTVEYVLSTHDVLSAHPLLSAKVTSEGISILSNRPPLAICNCLQRTLTYRVLRVASLAFLAYSNLYPRNCLDIYEAQGSL